LVDLIEQDIQMIIAGKHSVLVADELDKYLSTILTAIPREIYSISETGLQRLRMKNIQSAISVRTFTKNLAFLIFKL
jgi:hypothetical protein